MRLVCLEADPMPSPDAAPWSLSEASIRHHASAESFRRGQEYERRGAVSAMVRRGDVLQAEVEGSEPVPYGVRVTFDAGDVAAAVCTCPYDRGGWCKHIVAALLTYAGDPEAVDVRPALDEMLDTLSHAQLRMLLQRLVERDPSLADAIERQVALLSAMPEDADGATSAAPSVVDTRSVRLEVPAALHSLDRMRASEAYWYVGSAIGGVEEVLAEAWALIRGDQGAAALERGGDHRRVPRRVDDARRLER
jgi:hypothetical protein